MKKKTKRIHRKRLGGEAWVRFIGCVKNKDKYTALNKKNTIAIRVFGNCLCWGQSTIQIKKVRMN